MTPDQARKELAGDRWLQHLRDMLAQSEKRISQSQGRLAEQAARMAGLRDLRQLALTSELHDSLGQSLQLLISYREMILRELRNTERRRASENPDLLQDATATP